MTTPHKFPDRVRVIGWFLALLGLAQTVYYFVLQYSAENLGKGLAGSSHAGTIVLLHLLLGLSMVVAGFGLVLRQGWAFWASGGLLVAAIAVGIIELAVGAAGFLETDLSFPETVVAFAGLLVWALMLVWLVASRPVLVEARPPADIEQIDERTLAVIEATKKMSSRKTEDWGEEDDEDLVESLIWMAQARGGRDPAQASPVQAEQRRQELDRRMDSLPTVIDASPLAIAVGDRGGAITLWNPTAERLFGWSEAEMLGKPLPIEGQGMDRRSLLAQVVADGSVIGMESEQPRRDGALVPVSMSISVLPDETGSVGGFVVAFTDLTERRDALAEELARRRTHALEAAQTEIMAKFAEAGELQDVTHGGHAQRVSAITTLVAHELGFAKEAAVQMGRASLLHDIGKVGVAPEIWNKKGRLTDEEFEAVKTHTEVGKRILDSTESPLLKSAAEIAYSHHERWDGYGYLGLSGEAIPIGGRIVAVADAFDALTHDRPYRKARPMGQAVEQLRKESGLQFDPKVLGAFISVFEAGHLRTVNAGDEPSRART